MVSSWLVGNLHNSVNFFSILAGNLFLLSMIFLQFYSFFMKLSSKARFVFEEFDLVFLKLTVNGWSLGSNDSLETIRYISGSSSIKFWKIFYCDRSFTQTARRLGNF